MSKILIVENNPSIYAQIQKILGQYALDTLHAPSLAAAEELLQSHTIQIIISELNIANDNASALFIFGKPVLIITDNTCMRSAIKIMREGAADYISKPFTDDELMEALIGIVNEHKVPITITPKDKQSPLNDAQQNSAAISVHRTNVHKGMIGNSTVMQQVQKRILKAAPTKSTILIRGETGTGKELAARAIHASSDRREQPFIAVNCAAIPDTLIEAELFGHEKGAFTGAASKRAGLIEAAESGTLFLDEIGELPSEAQARLLRFIQESEIRRVGSNDARKVNVRLVAATHRDLKQMTEAGGFRQDLYFRINVVRIDLPPLNQRGSDIIEIAQALVARAAKKHGKAGLHLLPDAIQAILNYSWPGNIRELENVIERSTIMSDSLEINSQCLEIDSDLPPQSIISEPEHTKSQPPTSTQDTHDELSLEDYFQKFVLENQAHMNETQLAKKLGISRKCLWERRQRLNLVRKR